MNLMYKPKLGVTGATGMIGGVLLPLLEKSHYKVVVFTRKKLESSAEIVVGELLDGGKVEEFVARVDVVLHMAAAVNLVSGDETYFRQVNVEASRLILEACKKLGKKLVLVSTIAVFKDTGQKLRNEKWDLIRSSKNRYIQTKREQLLLVESYHEIEYMVIFPAVVINPKIYSSREMTMTGWRGWLWQNLGGGIPGGLMATIGKKDRIMNLVAVEDLCRGIIAVLEKGKWGEGYILGGENISVGEYLQKMRTNYGKKTAWFRIPNWIIAGVGALAGKIPKVKVLREISENIPVNQYFSSAKAVEELGYKIKWRV